jgi:hypothetical protein
MNDSPDFCVNKGPYYNHYVHLMSFGSIWIAASVIGLYHYENLAIIFLFSGISLFNPIYKLIRSALSLCPIASDDPLRMIITCMTIGVPIGIIVGFLPFLENGNAFFPAFAILFGMVFLTVSYVYKLKRYFLLALVLIGGEIGMMTMYDSFTNGGFFAGASLIITGIIVRFWGASMTQNLKVMMHRKKVIAS